MKKQSMRRLITLFLSMLAAIAVIQFLRIQSFYQLIPPVKASFHGYRTMSARAQDAAGEGLKIYIYQDQSKLSRRTAANLEMALQYAKVPYEPIDANRIESLTPSPYHVLVLTGEVGEKHLSLQKIRDFVRKGGRLFVANRFLDRTWDDLVGIAQNGGFIDKSIYGVHFNRTLFPGYPDIPKTSNFISNSMLDVILKNGATVYLTGGSQPMLWTYRFGNGKVVYWNATTLVDKDTRGLLLQSLSLATPVFVSSEAAVQVIFLDDFPSPVPNGDAKSTQRNYGVSVKSFYRNIWWRDLQQWEKSYGTVYTGGMIGTYRQDHSLTVEELTKRDRPQMLFFGRRLLEMGGEIGMHGYNHQPLVTSAEPLDPTLAYRPWENRQAMETSLERAKKVYKYYFPNRQIRTYVPPSNILNQIGLSAIHQALPSVKTISSSYVGRPDKGAFVQEFGFNHQYPDIYNFPRITSGYEQTNVHRFIQTDAIANFGVVSHFIHPDDVLDSDRAVGDGWPDMSRLLERMLKHIRKAYPYIDPVTASEARRKMVLYQKEKVHIRYLKNEIHISGHSLVLPSDFLIRVEDGKILKTGTFPFGTVRSLPGSDHLYVVKMVKPYANLSLKDG